MTSTTPTDDARTDSETDNATSGRLDRIAAGLATHTGTATAVSTVAVILVLAGLLWAGTGINNGLEAPQAVVIPTVWIAAIAGALVLAALFAILAFLYHLAPADQQREREREREREHERERELVRLLEHHLQSDPQQTGDQQQSQGHQPQNEDDLPGDVINAGSQGSIASPTTPAADPTVEQRVNDNWPDAATPDSDSPDSSQGDTERDKAGEENGQDTSHWRGKRNTGKSGGPSSRRSGESDQKARDEVTNTGSEPATGSSSRPGRENEGNGRGGEDGDEDGGETSSDESETYHTSKQPPEMKVDRDEWDDIVTEDYRKY